MGNSIGPSVTQAWKTNQLLLPVSGPWLNYAGTREDFPYAIFEIRPGRTLPSFGGDEENQYAVEMSVYALTEEVARSFLDPMDAVFHMKQFPMTAPEQCMLSRHERPGDVRQAGVDKKNRPVYRARCVYQVQVFVPAS